MNSYKRSIIAAMSIFLILDTIAVAARIYVRTLLIRGFGWDDATLCLSFVSFLIQKLSDDVVVMVRQNADGDFCVDSSATSSPVLWASLPYTTALPLMETRREVCIITRTRLNS